MSKKILGTRKEIYSDSDVAITVTNLHKSFKLPTDMSDARLYKQAGNSVCVSVIKRIAEQIIKAVEPE